MYLPALSLFVCGVADLRCRMGDSGRTEGSVYLPALSLFVCGVADLRCKMGDSGSGEDGRVSVLTGLVLVCVWCG